MIDKSLNGRRQVTSKILYITGYELIQNRTRLILCELFHGVTMITAPAYLLTVALWQTLKHGYIMIILNDLPFSNVKISNKQ